MRKKLIVVGSAVAALAVGGTGAALAVNSSSDDNAISGPNADRAGALAVEANGGGTVNSVEKDNENGATYGVEVRNGDGSTVDVRLDSGFKVVAIEPDSEQADTPEQPGDPVD